MFFLPYLAVAVPTLAVIYKLVPKNFYQTTFTDEETLASECCNILNDQLPDQVHFPGSVIYDTQQKDYYSGEQSALTPSCRVSPKTSVDLSRIVKIASTQKCAFSVKCGGHMAGLGASNIGSSGFTIDLGALNGVQMSEGRDIVSAAAGSRWTDVYNMLSPYNLTVVGGRSAGVGVGGFLSHGGISFISHEHGFGSDNIVAYEVVLSDGSIVNASPSERGDLYWALKLGSTNYGIITRFDLTTFPTTPTLWGGSMFFDISLGPSLLEHLADFTARLGNDPVAMSVVSIAYDPSQKQYMIWSPNMHFGPVEYPPLFSGMRSFEPFHSSMKVRTLVNMVEEVFDSAPGNGRAQWFTFTFKVDTKLPWDIYLKGKEIFAPILEDRPGAMWAIVVQPITSAMVKAGSGRNGGNPSGISEDDGNLFLFHCATFWTDAKDDSSMKQGSAELQSWVETTARERRLLHPFIYMNYALAGQKVYEGVGVDNLQRMKATKLKYDPENVFGRFWRGGFKL